MKKLVLIFLFSGGIFFSATAQTTKVKVKKQNTTQPGTAKVKQAPSNEKIKLDDLKNPFDTNKVKTTRPARLKN